MENCQEKEAYYYHKVGCGFQLNNTVFNDCDYQKWLEIQDNAQKNMMSVCKNPKILIEVAAQHPLKDRAYPDLEFQLRLDKAIEILQEKTEDGMKVEIYVPGSLHLNTNGIIDKVSLSTSGKNYLVSKGIPSEKIHGDDLNSAYDNDGTRAFTGVYNSADECYIASKYFIENGFGQLFCICSPNQLMRKSLFYLYNGIVPQVVTVPTQSLFHNFIYEIMEAVPKVILDDHDWQGEDSKDAIRTRKARMKDFISNQ